MLSNKLNERAAAARRCAAPRINRAAPVRRVTVCSSAAQAPAAPKTGHHSVEAELRQEALSFFFEDAEQVKCTPTSGGVNNVVQYVDTPAGDRYVLRIYNNGNNTPKVAYEHGILAQLSQQKLSFDVPKTKPCMKTGASHVTLSNGAQACIFEIIPGSLAKTTSPEEVGRATGELCTAMAKVQMPPGSCVMAPYWDVFSAHWATNRDLFYNEVANNPGFNVCRAEIDFLVDEIRAIEPRLEQYRKMGLPEQVIHGDLHFDNVMVVGDAVSGLLDFEFCVYDWRVMEMAVALSKYVGEADPLGLCTAFVTGYAKHGELTQPEIDILPDLINLRIFSNVVYFTGRAYAKEDSLDSLTSRAPAYAKRVRWVNANRQALVDAVTQRMQALKAESKLVAA